LPDAAKLFRIALKVAAHHCEVGVDPYVHATAIDRAVVHATHDHECFLVLRADRVVEFGEVVAATLPIGEDHGNGTWIAVVGNESERLGQQLGDARRIGAILDRQQVAAVVPRHRRQDRGRAFRRAWEHKAVHGSKL
jgi:hypothetical protein